jgi:hypothetical protein
MEARSRTIKDTQVSPVIRWPASPRLPEVLRRPQAWSAVTVLWFFAASAVAAQGGDSTKSAAPASAGALPAGWTLRTEAKGDGKDISFRVMEPGYHLTLGPAVIVYRQKDRVAGPFHTLAKLHQTKKLEHAEGYGLFIGGKELDRPSQAYTYFLIRADGKFLIKRREGERLTELTNGWQAHSAINPVDAKGASANLLEIDAKRDPRVVSFIANGKEVHRIPASEVELQGIVGLRVNHNLDIHIEEFAIHK